MSSCMSARVSHIVLTAHVAVHEVRPAVAQSQDDGALAAVCEKTEVHAGPLSAGLMAGSIQLICGSGCDIAQSALKLLLNLSTQGNDENGSQHRWQGTSGELRRAPLPALLSPVRPLCLCDARIRAQACVRTFSPRVEEEFDATTFNREVLYGS